MVFDHRLISALIIISITIILFSIRIEIVSPGLGIVENGSGKIEILSPSNGVVSNYGKKNGASISIGEPILTITDIETSNSLRSIESEIKILEGHRNKLKLDLGCLNKFAYNAKRSDSQIDLCKLGESSINDKFILEERYTNEKNDLAKKSLKSAKVELAVINNKIVNIEQQNKLIKNSSASKKDILQSESMLFDTRLENVSIELKIQELLSEINELKSGFEISVFDEINRIKRDLDSNELNLVKLHGSRLIVNSRSELNVIKSPVEGVVLKKTDYIANGSYVEKGKSLLTIDMLSGNKKIKGKFDVKYRPFLSKGILVKVMTSSPGKRNVYKGTILHISSDSFKYEENSQSERYYEVEIEIDGGLNAHEIHEGSNVSLFALTNEISLWQYITGLFYSPLVYSVG